MAHVAQWKKEVVQKLIEKAKDYNIVGVVNLDNLPSRELQSMRRSLRDKVEIIVAKKRLIQRALDQLEKHKQGISKLKDYLQGIVGLIFTNENPFKIMKILKENQSDTYAKPGQIAPQDIVVYKGPTSFSPGPIISELAKFGLKTAVEKGKVAIKEDKVVAKEGDVISADLAALLKRLDIKPMKVGLNLVAVYEQGIVFDKSVLEIDEEQYISRVKTAWNHAFNLAFNIVYPTKEVIEPLFVTAIRDAKALAIERVIPEKEVIEQILIKAAQHAKALKQKTSL